MAPLHFNAKAITNALASFAVVFLFVTFCYLLKEGFVCPCDPNENTWFCSLYIYMPFFIFLGFMIVMDNTLFGICEHEQWSTYIVVVLKRFLKAVTVGLIWIVIVLIDGDYLVCLKTTSLNITVRSEQPACKQEPTSDEFADIRLWKNLSLVTGLILLCWLLFAWAFFLCCSKRTMHMFYFKVLYAEYVLEETDDQLRKELRELAKTRAESKVRAKLIQIRNDVGPINPPAGYERFGTFEELSDS